MITIRFDTFDVHPGMSFIDVGCGQGRHSYEAYRRGARVTAFDLNESDLADVKTMFGAMEAEGQGGPGGSAEVQHGDVTQMPFADDSFDRVLASEILEHIPDVDVAIGEIARIAKPGGLVAVTVPRNWPEQICWKLSDEYHEVEGGHVRIFKATDLVRRLTAAGLEPIGQHHAHALHSPYWWIKCASGTERENALTRGYHRLLVWDMMRAPAVTRVAERALNPVMGKSFVVYLRKPV
ncbi:class I SAM-dependent methyltransferase [Allobranchiibius huperziae]|uniref:SAM-dependent methyltransferase n=1 Tax=Allobranchiibius huperziae TaxID=1874116 RepID=A0A853DF94_9MICO|nr:class I SAM-dependent methyltransferase [Allobranchiibius huperziae]NYJ76172.1 SAM-dependent methyltransferase [Allobranchiibius huperziae]